MSPAHRTATNAAVALGRVLLGAAIAAALFAEPLAPRRRAELAGIVADARVDALVLDLADDGIRGNGIAACAALCALPPAVVPALERALAAPDEQQRVLAGAVLRVRCERFDLAPCAALLANAVDALRGAPAVDTRGTPASPLAATSFRFLLPPAAAARAPLLRALEGGDRQQRLAAAFLLAGRSEAALAPRLVRGLVPHLADNHTGGDALFAAHALYRVGAPGLAAMREWRAAVDTRAARCSSWSSSICASRRAIAPRCGPAPRSSG